MSRNDCFTTQLIDANGDFNAAGLEDFIRKIKLAECGLSYAVVSIMGPQSSGMFVEIALFQTILSLHFDLFISICILFYRKSCNLSFSFYIVLLASLLAKFWS